MTTIPFEKQYLTHVKNVETHGLISLGVMQSGSWRTDPRHLLFSLARYKFVAKMLSGKKNVLEIGCCDGFFSRIVLQEVKRIHGIDIDKTFIEEAIRKYEINLNFSCQVYDILKSSMPSQFDAAYALDVLEHISCEDEDIFLKNIALSLDDDGEFIVGMPSKESQGYASELSKAGHVNCKNGYELKKTMLRHFKHVFLFSMNDEVVHTGYTPLAHYVIAVCAGCLR